MDDNIRVERSLKNQRQIPSSTTPLLHNLRDIVQLPNERKRRCTDVGCLVVLIVCCVIHTSIAVVAFRFGNPKVILNPRDSLGNLCGFDEGYEEKPYLFFFDHSPCTNLSSQLYWLACLTPQICVNKCPEFYWDYRKAAQIEKVNGIIYIFHPALDIAYSFLC